MITLATGHEADNQEARKRNRFQISHPAGPDLRQVVPGSQLAAFSQAASQRCPGRAVTVAGQVDGQGERPSHGRRRGPHELREPIRTNRLAPASRGTICHAQSPAAAPVMRIAEVPSTSSRPRWRISVQPPDRFKKASARSTNRAARAGTPIKANVDRTRSVVARSDGPSGLSVHPPSLCC